MISFIVYGPKKIEKTNCLGVYGHYIRVTNAKKLQLLYYTVYNMSSSNSSTMSAPWMNIDLAAYQRAMDTITASLNKTKQELGDLHSTHDQTVTDHKQLLVQHDQLKTEYEKFKVQHETLKDTYAHLLNDYASLQDDYNYYANAPDVHALCDQINDCISNFQAHYSEFDQTHSATQAPPAYDAEESKTVATAVATAATTTVASASDFTAQAASDSIAQVASTGSNSYSCDIGKSGWSKYSDSVCASIDTAFSDPTHKTKFDVFINGQNYTIDIASMEQINKQTGYVRKIRKDLSPSSDQKASSISPSMSFNERGTSWLPYDDATTSAAKTAFDSGSATFGFKRNGVDYSLDFISKKQTNATTGFVRDIKFDFGSSSSTFDATTTTASTSDMASVTTPIASTSIAAAVATAVSATSDSSSTAKVSFDTSVVAVASPTVASSPAKFSFFDNGSWISYDSTTDATIDSAFTANAPTTTFARNNVTYSIDFGKMTQMNTSSGFIRRVRCAGEKVAMFHDDYASNWFPYDKKTSDTICFIQASGSTSPFDIQSNGTTYEIDVVKMTQTNKSTGTSRKIQIA
jgi:WWE domain